MPRDFVVENCITGVLTVVKRKPGEADVDACDGLLVGNRNPALRVVVLAVVVDLENGLCVVVVVVVVEGGLVNGLCVVVVVVVMVGGVVNGLRVVVVVVVVVGGLV